MVWIEASDLVLRSASWMGPWLVLLAWGLTWMGAGAQAACAPDPPAACDQRALSNRCSAGLERLGDSAREPHLFQTMRLEMHESKQGKGCRWGIGAMLKKKSRLGSRGSVAC